MNMFHPHTHTHTDHPVTWYEAQVEQNQDIFFTITVPEIERFASTRMSTVILSPALPSLTNSSNNSNYIPEAVRAYADANGMGGLLFESPQDQSSCDHLTSPTMIDAVTVKDGRCHFYEPFGGSNLWTIMDEAFVAPEVRFKSLYSIYMHVCTYHVLAHSPITHTSFSPQIFFFSPFF